MFETILTFENVKIICLSNFFWQIIPKDLAFKVTVFWEIISGMISANNKKANEVITKEMYTRIKVTEDLIGRTRYWTGTTCSSCMGVPICT